MNLALNFLRAKEGIMNVVHGREQGTWLHPAFFEIGRSIPHCRMMDQGLRPCHSSAYKEKAMWCANCVAREALQEVIETVTHMMDCKGEAICDRCNLTRRFFQNGMENDKKFGLPK